MVTLDEAFDAWLDEHPYSMVTSRREWAHINGIGLGDLKWAFAAGWTSGRISVFKGLNE